MTSRAHAERLPADDSRQANIDQDYFGILSTQGRLPMLESFTAERPSLQERLEIGRRLRKTVPLADHASFAPAKGRADPVAVLERQNATRVRKLVPIRNARMLASPFGFLRGSAAIMAADLESTPTTGLLVAACGDMHVSNFGLFGSAERKLIFAINDFDEVHPGPWEWDSKRLAASAAVAARFMGGGRSDAETAARATVRAYRRQIRRYSKMGFLEVWYDQIDEQKILDAVPSRLRRHAEETIAGARAKGRFRVLDRLTEVVDGEHRIVEDVPLIVRETHRADGKPISEALDDMLRSYFETLPDDRKRLLSRYRIIDVARKVVGVGSVGTGCWIVFLRGLDDDDPLFLQVKEARASALAPHVRTKLPIANQGRRVVVGQRLTQGSPDIFLGWGEDNGGYFYVRQLADMKGGERFVAEDKERLDGFPEYCGLCGWALALAHAKSGDAAMIAGYCGKSDELDDAIAKFALAYAAQTSTDHAALVKAARAGRIEVSHDEGVV
jgi:uncharacterized protein (DUF2252 family)